ncbi:MAG: addiction module antidote protein [Limisphaerales bacterium]
MKPKSYEDDLFEELKDPGFASEYLALALATEDQATFLTALRDVVDVGGGIGTVAKQVRIQRQSLYRSLSNQGNPRLTTLLEILKAVGLRLAVTPGTKPPSRRKKR